MANKILLIRPANIYLYNNYPPLNLISLASTLREAGFETVIVNAGLERDALAAVDRHLDGCLLVGLSVLTSEIPDTYRLIEHIKSRSEVPIVLGGWHCTLFPNQTAACPHVDYVIAGEGDRHLVTLATALRDGHAPANRIFDQKILEIESLPCPDYSLEPRIEEFITNYLTDTCAARMVQPARWLPYQSSRGCPSQCTFCINTVTGNQRYRKKSAAKTLDEVEHLVRAHRLTHVKFIDDNFFVDAHRVRAVAQGMIDRKLDVTWDGECRCDYFNARHLNDETLDLCVRSGLLQLTLGIESGSPRTLEIMRKGITVEQAERAVARCDAHGIIARSSFILEIPGEGFDDIRQTIRFINRLRKYPQFVCGVGTFRPYPKCELTSALLAEGYLTEPDTLEGWTDAAIIDLYTSAEQIRPWQVNGKYSERAAMYLNMESKTRVGDHQIDRSIDRLRNNCFAFLAKLRNRTACYALPVDKWLYRRFLKAFYRRRHELEQAGQYPLRDVTQKETA